MAFDVNQIVGLVEKLGGDHQGASNALSGLSKIDPSQHADLLKNFAIDPDQLSSGGYAEHLTDLLGKAGGGSGGGLGGLLGKLKDL